MMLVVSTFLRYDRAGRQKILDLRQFAILDAGMMPI